VLLWIFDSELAPGLRKLITNLLEAQKWNLSELDGLRKVYTRTQGACAIVETVLRDAKGQRGTIGEGSPLKGPEKQVRVHFVYLRIWFCL
jgi:hypothetical protein